MGRMQDLDSLVKQFGWETGVELGVANGQTLFHLLENNPNLYMVGVDAYDFSYGKGDKHSTGFKQYELQVQSEVRKQVEEKLEKYKERASLKVLPSIIAAEDFKDESLDFVFIDADHRESFARADIAAWVPKVKHTGYLTGHDWKFSSVEKALNGMLPGWESTGSIWHIAKKDICFA